MLGTKKDTKMKKDIIPPTREQKASVQQLLNEAPSPRWTPL